MQDYDAFTGRNWFSPSFQHKKKDDGRDDTLLELLDFLH